MKSLFLTRDNTDAVAYGFNCPDYINNTTLVALVAQSFAVPTGANFFSVKGDTDFFALYNGNMATIASASDGSGSELNPEGIRRLDGITVLSFASKYACTVCRCFWK